jgi:predicted ATPase/DNA-binding SARP family transcriptional activator
MPASEMAPAPLAITLFGPMQVQVHGRPLPPLRSHKHLWLLALLTLRPNRPVEREWLAGTMWPEVEQSNAFDNLRPVLSELRKALGDQSQRLQSPDRFTLVLDLTHAEVDLLRFDAAIHSGTLSELEQAVGLYRGPLLEGCREEWAVPERASREQVYLQALQTLGEASLAGEDYAAAASYYQQAVRMDPWREAERRGWMEALARQGDINAALQVYREFVALLKNDPKAIPDAQTTALYQRLRAEVRQRAGTHAVVAAEVVAVSVVKGYLPHSITDLVGREDERIEVALQLRQSRLVTLTGMGGIGKTRLAREVAGEVVSEYADGVWLVALDVLSEGRLVIQQIATVLGLREERGRTLLQSVTEHLRKKRLLLVLDNCEHLLEASGQVVAHLLGECAQIRILATSREALGITGETVWAVPALSVPVHLPVRPSTLVRVVMGYESVQLFVERAQAVQQSFALSGSNARLVAQACQQLEGIPLAIELAAARVRAMSVEQIASRLNDYLGFLTVGNRAAQLRQQTLRATLDWSYALLSEAERSLLKRLSVFVGGWTLEAAEQVCGDFGLPILDFGLKVDSLDASRSGQEPAAIQNPPEFDVIQNPKSKIQNGEVLDLLTSLVDKSLVLFEAREPGEGRYRLLEMVRQYAAESLLASGEAEQVKGRHQGWYLTFAERAEPALRTGEQVLWLTRLKAEHDNLRSALAWSLKSEGESPSDSPIALLFCGALHLFWRIHGHLAEGRAWCEKALQANTTQERTHARAKALNGAGSLAYSQGDYAIAQALFEESLATQREIGDRYALAASLVNLGNAVREQGEYTIARAWHEESLAIRREIGDREGIVFTLESFAALIAAEATLATEAVTTAEVSAEIGAGLRRAARMWGAAGACRDDLGAPLRLQEQAIYDQQMAQARSVLGLEAFATAQEEGRAMTLEQAVAYALEEGGDTIPKEG